MDHFNITVQDGAMVSTRRGFKVSKQKHNGTAFINSSASNINPGRKDPGGESLLPTAGELTFVNNGGDGRRSRRKTRAASQDRRKTGSRSLGARETTQSRLSPDARLASSSPRTTFPENLDPQYASSTASANSPSYIGPTPLPPWAAYSHSKTSTQPVKRLHFMALAFGQRETIHSEERHPAAEAKPADIIERSTWQVHDPTTIHCALTMGALFDAVKEGKNDTPQLTALASQLYSIVNRRVSENDRSNKARDVTMRAVASLAIISGYQAKSEHWHVHMRGLLNLVDIAGGPERLFPSTLDMIRCADIVGAISAATRPCTLFIGLHCNARYVSRLQCPGNTARTVLCGLEDFHIDLEMVKTLAATAEFCKENATSHDQDASPEILEDFYFLSHRLLTIPQPLLNYDKAIYTPDSMDLSLQTEHLSSPEMTTEPSADSTMKAVEMTLQILVLMYLKETMLDVPCNNNIILSVLEKQVLLILSGWRSNLLYAAQTPVIIWICLAGHTFAAWKKDTLIEHRNIYEQLLDGILNRDTTAMTYRPTEQMLSFCKCFDLGRVRGGTWAEHEAIKGMLEMSRDE